MFTLAPLVILLWTTAPKLWSRFSTSAQLVGNNPSSLLYLPGKLFVSGEKIVKSLTCDNLEFPPVDYTKSVPRWRWFLPPPLMTRTKATHLPQFHFDGIECVLPSAVPCVLLFVSLQAAVPVLHWAASWWFILPGWETNLVSLAPSLTRQAPICQAPAFSQPPTTRGTGTPNQSNQGPNTSS
ncbi:hypothetical protein DSO57_1034577 [Entomophthora muscae]|uniref:Uncharacterized protein n=1 Tax=Entomophthora muscae TaxID=34485 RepID=A0ACC2SCR9_9FUNG|nr:hypothetical protein DSO57_1034577 [Entomophthora muscae]